MISETASAVADPIVDNAPKVLQATVDMGSKAITAVQAAAPKLQEAGEHAGHSYDDLVDALGFKTVMIILSLTLICIIFALCACCCRDAATATGGWPPKFKQRSSVSIEDIEGGGSRHGGGDERSTLLGGFMGRSDDTNETPRTPHGLNLGGGHLGLKGIQLPQLDLPPPGTYCATAATTNRSEPTARHGGPEPLQPRGTAVPRVQMPAPGELTDTLNAPPVPRGRHVAPLAIPSRGGDAVDNDGSLAPRGSGRGDLTYRSTTSGGMTSRTWGESQGELTARNMQQDADHLLSQLNEEDPYGYEEGEQLSGMYEDGGPLGANDTDDPTLMTVRCTIVKDGKFTSPMSTRHRPTRQKPLAEKSQQQMMAQQRQASPRSGINRDRVQQQQIESSEWKARQAEKALLEAQRSNQRAVRAASARQRLADAEAALAAQGWAPAQPRPSNRETTMRPSKGLPKGKQRPPPVEHPEELPEAKQTIAALRAAQRRLQKEIAGLSAGSGPKGDSLGKERFARTRLVTIRLVDERLAAEGRTPEHRDVIRLAGAAGLRSPECLVWPGGLRVVFAEESVATPAASSLAESGLSGDAAIAAAAEKSEQVERLSQQLAELHGQQMAFFLALLDAKLGFDTASSAPP